MNDSPTARKRVDEREGEVYALDRDRDVEEGTSDKKE